MSELDAFLDEQVDSVEESTPEAEGEPTAPEEEQTPEEEPKAEAKPEEPEESWTKKAVIDERRKRQALEAERDKLLEQLKAEPKQETRPDVFEDSDKAFEHTEQKIEQRLLNQKIEMSQELMRSMHEDYDELETEFIDLAKADPSLVQKMNNSALPAKFVRDTALKARNLSKVDEIPQYESEIAKLKAELEALKSGKQLPPSLAGKSSKSKDTQSNIGDELADILGR